MNRAFGADQQAGADLYATGAEIESCLHLPLIGNAASRNHRDFYGIADLGNECHGRHFSDMTATFAAFCDDGICAKVFQMFRQNGCGNHGDDHDLPALEGIHVLPGIPCTGGYHLDVFLQNHLDKFIDQRMHQHQIDAEGLVGCLATGLDFGPE